jgi:polysaccharide export outer membrane protein
MLQARTFITVFMFLLVSGGSTFLCAQGAQSRPGTDLLAKASSKPNQTDSLEAHDPRYVIQQLDVLLVSFPITPELNQTVTVLPDGYINLQGAGSLHAQGLTAPELVDAIKRAYSGTLNAPIINVDIKDFQKPFFTVSGQVGKPGKYELRSTLTVAEAIAVADGLAPTAKTQIFLFHRVSGNRFKVQKLNLKDVLNGKRINEDPTVQPGDMIYVPENFITKFRKYVPYSFNAGTYLQPTPF